MKKYVLLGIILLLIIGLVFGLFFYFKKPNETEILLYGNIEIREVSLSFRVSGKLADLYFEEGDYVKKGQMVAKLQDDTFLADLAEAKAKMTEVSSIRDNAQSIYKRNLALCYDETISKEECEQILTNKNKAIADYDLSLAQFKNSKIALDDTKLIAPNDGIILTRINEKGTVLSAGVPVYSMSLFKPLWARAYISEKDLGKIKLGQKAYISSDAMPDKEFSAHIGFISPVAEFTPKTVETVSLRTDLVYRLRVIVDEDVKEGNDPSSAENGLHLYLRQGMPVNIRIPLEKEVLEGNKDNCAAGASGGG